MFLKDEFGCGVVNRVRSEKINYLFAWLHLSLSSLEEVKLQGD